MGMNGNDGGRRRQPPVIAVLIAALLLAGAGTAAAQAGRYEGSLGPGDTKLGKYFDIYQIELKAGDRLIATLTSEDFDTYLLAESPNGEEFENDDFDGSECSKLDLIARSSGKWQIKVTSYEDGETGDYRLDMVHDRIGELKSFPGSLEGSDPVSLKGEHYDTYDLSASANQRIVLSLVSDDFDPYLVVRTPSGKLMVNDDFGGELEARLDFVAETAGTYKIHATSNAGGESGGYVLNAVRGGIMQPKTLRGELTSRDPELEENGYYDAHPVPLKAGQFLLAELTSDAFDTYLVIEYPDGTVEENDDYNDRTDTSRLEIIATSSGTYTIKAAGYGTDDTGPYTLKVYSPAP